LVPQIYEDQIHHLTRQGYIVIFPQYQRGHWAIILELGLLRGVTQQPWLDQAVESVDMALDQIGDQADLEQVYGYGHSTGGALLLALEAMLDGRSVPVFDMGHWSDGVAVRPIDCRVCE
jgi:alpha-beta hydrolase superfamily lysophospholipase